MLNTSWFKKESRLVGFICYIINKIFYQMTYPLKPTLVLLHRLTGASIFNYKD